MTNKSENPPAFPTDINANFGRQGMSLRDYFAGQALTGLITAFPDCDCGAEGLTQDAYMYADAMLKARENLK
jgi:hypothetical protein